MHELQGMVLKNLAVSLRPDGYQNLLTLHKNLCGSFASLR
jgi:hypothetical protein